MTTGTGRRQRRERRPPVVECDGPCRRKNQASWMTLHELGAYCRDCIGPALARARSRKDGVNLGDVDAVEWQQVIERRRALGERGYSESARVVRAYAGLDEGSARGSSEGAE